MKKALYYLLQWFLLSILGALILMIPAFIVGLIACGFANSDDIMSNGWVLSISNIGSQLLPLYVFWKKKYADFSFLWSERALKFYMSVVVLAISCFLLESVYEQYVTLPDWDWMSYDDVMQMMLNPIGLISVCLMAPLIEEALFRGAIERTLLKKGFNPWFAIIFSAVLFALVHLNLVQGVPAFFWGIVLGWVYYRTRSIWPGVLIHFIVNTLSSVLTLLSQHYPAIEEPMSSSVSWTVLFVGLVLLLVALKFINKEADHVELSSSGFQDDDDIKAIAIAQYQASRNIEETLSSDSVPAEDVVPLPEDNINQES